MAPRALYFSATWCSPCKVFGPVLTKVAEETGVTLVKVDVDQQGPLAEEYGIRSVPTVVMLDAGGKEIGRIVGARNDPAFIKDALTKE